MSEHRKRHEVTGDRVMDMSVLEMVAMVEYIQHQPCGEAVTQALAGAIAAVDAEGPECDTQPVSAVDAICPRC